MLPTVAVLKITLDVCLIKKGRKLAAQVSLWLYRILINISLMTFMQIISVASPTHPGPPNCTLITGTSIEIEWNPPSDQGGRTDTFYTVEHQAIGSTGDYIAGISTNNTSYPISNLEPVTQYRIRVVAENCVSEQDMRPGIRATRTSEVVICETGEGSKC